MSDLITRRGFVSSTTAGAVLGGWFGRMAAQAAEAVVIYNLQRPGAPGLGAAGVPVAAGRASSPQGDEQVSPRPDVNQPTRTTLESTAGGE